MLEPRGDSLKRADMISSTDPTVLALDAAGGACSAALWRAGGVVARRWSAMDRGHAEALMPMVEDVVADHGYGAVDLICVGVGPGGYTGLRIALSAARGLGLATGLPMLGIRNTDVHETMARVIMPAGNLAGPPETRRAEFYVQLYGDEALAENGPAILSLAETVETLRKFAGELVIAGDAVARFRAAVSDAPVSWTFLEDQHADAGIFAELGAQRASAASRVPPQPLYLRPPDASPPSADRQRLRG